MPGSSAYYYVLVTCEVAKHGGHACIAYTFAQQKSIQCFEQKLSVTVTPFVSLSTFFLPSHHHKHDIVRTFEDKPDISKDFRRFTTMFQRFTKIFQVFSSPIPKIFYAKSNYIPVAFHLKVEELYHSVHLLVFSLTGSRFHIVKTCVSQLLVVSCVWHEKESGPEIYFMLVKTNMGNWLEITVIQILQLILDAWESDRSM